MTETPIFRLKDGKTITIYSQPLDDCPSEWKDVQRIRILNDIVWEKTRTTKLSLTATPNTVTVGKPFNLTAIVVDDRGEAVNGNVVFTGKGLPAAGKVVKAVNGIAKVQNIIIKSITNNTEKNTYKAHFNQTSFYLSSEKSINITIKKETPIFKLLGTSKIYPNWIIGGKLTASNGKTPLIKQSITLTINNKTYHLTTDSGGVVRQKIGAYSGQKPATFTYNGNTKYTEKIVTHTYYMQKSVPQTLSYNNSSYTTNNSTQRDWIRVSTSPLNYRCKNSGVPCDSNSGTIASASGTVKQPCPLTIIFNQPSSIIIYKATLTFNSKHDAGCNGSYYGGFFKGLKVSLSIDNGSNFTQPNKKKPKDFSYYYGYRGYYYSSTSLLPQEITWAWQNGTSLKNNPRIKIEYPANGANCPQISKCGAEEALIRLFNIKLTVSYIPKQDTSVFK